MLNYQIIYKKSVGSRKTINPFPLYELYDKIKTLHIKKGKKVQRRSIYWELSC